MTSAEKILILFVMLLAAPGCAGEKETVKGTVRGTIYVIGNEPFTSLAIQDSLGTMYRISASKEIQDKLLARQGKMVELEYSRIDTNYEGVTLSIKAFKEITR